MTGVVIVLLLLVLASQYALYRGAESVLEVFEERADVSDALMRSIADEQKSQRESWRDGIAQVAEVVRELKQPRDEKGRYERTARVAFTVARAKAERDLEVNG